MLLISPVYRVFKWGKRYFHPKQNIEKSSVADLHPAERLVLCMSYKPLSAGMGLRRVYTTDTASSADRSHNG